MFEPLEIMKYCFFIFDKDKSGYIDQDELNLFVSTLHKGGVTGNIESALKSLDFNDDGRFDFKEFEAMHKQFVPLAAAPGNNNGPRTPASDFLLRFHVGCLYAICRR